MQQRLTLATAALLTVPPLLWAANAVTGRLVADLVPAATLNLLRWVLAFVFLLPFAGWVLQGRSGYWPHWKRFALLGFTGIGCYNALQYLALQTSTPINTSLVAGSTPVFMLAIGALFFGRPVAAREIAGTLLSITGVLFVLVRGDFGQLATLRFVPGDLYMVLAALAWSVYSWMLTRPGDPPAIRNDWAAFLMAQLVPGIAWSALFAAGEWAVAERHVAWGWPLAAALVFIAIGPAILAYRCWASGVHRAGPAIAGFFSNLTPLFAALMSTLFLGEAPRTYHAIAFLLLVGGILVSSRRGTT